MIIMKCNKCGELMHKTNKCFSCGNTNDFDKLPIATDIHENVRDEYEKLEYLVQNGKFDEAKTLSKTVLEWMPTCSDIFWLRLLIKNQCSTDDELIRKGFSVSESADYHNAVLFGNDVQKKTYALVASKIVATQEILRKAIVEHEYSEKDSTQIVQLQDELPKEIDSRKKSLFEQWKQLETIEHEMLAIEKDCIILVQEHKDILENTTTSANNLKAKTYKMEECTYEEHHKYQIQFGELLHQSEQAKSSIDAIKKQHPWIVSYVELKVKRDSLANHIASELSSLKSYENKIQATVSEIERIEEKHKNAIKALTTFRFSEVRDLLGENKFEAALFEAGVR